MKLLLIHQAFVTPREGGGTRHFEFGRHLLKAGHEMTVVASSLSYLDGKPYEGGKVQDVEGIEVRRAYTMPGLHKNFFMRVVAYLSFMVTAVYEGLKVKDIDLVMGTSPPLFQAVSAWLVSWLRRKPFLLEIRDLWPEFAIDMGVLTNPVLIKMARWLESFLYARADYLLVNSPAYRTYLIEKGIDPSRVSLISNGVAPEMFETEADNVEFRKRYDLGKKFVLTYAGALGPANDIDTLLHAAKLLEAETDFHLLLVGDGKAKPALETLAKELNLKNVTFTGSLPKSEMKDVLAASDVCAAILKNIPMFKTTYPNKVFDYMAAGRPVLLAIDGVIREVVEASGGGLFVEPGSAERIADGVRHFLSDKKGATAMGEAGRSYVAKHFNRSEHAGQFVALLEKIASRGKSGGGWYRRRGKRLFDLFLTVPGLILISPLIVFLWWKIRSEMGTPVLFTQERAGLGGQPFKVRKFRTMNDERDAEGNLLPDADRMTPLGAMMRRNSLDEFPQLFNVVRGEMSLVGPRPLLTEYLPLYDQRQMRRHTVMPGITGWAQVKGRNLITWKERLELDAWYAENQSFLLDLKILFLTFFAVIKREGISAPGEATMPRFTGEE